MKDVSLPEKMQQLMAMQAEALREKRARITKAEGELEAAKILAKAATEMGTSPAALEIRRLQTISEIGAEHNSTTVIMIPAEFSHLARKAGDYIDQKTSPQA
jgi:regulator of protease activity HflC (stomatin/prohibitin superfamily)